MAGWGRLLPGAPGVARVFGAGSTGNLPVPPGDSARTAGSPSVVPTPGGTEEAAISIGSPHSARA